MRRAVRFFQLLVLLCGLASLPSEPVFAIGCSSAEFIDDCREAEENAQQAANAYCMQTYGVGAYPVNGTCHWYGEEDPGSCIENHGENCSCYDWYENSMECILW